MNRRVYKPPTAQRIQTQIRYNTSFVASEKYSKHIETGVCDQDGRTVLHIIAIQGNDDDADHALRAGCDVNCQDRHGCRPIHYAAERGCIGYVKKLITHGAELNVLNNEGHSPLMSAASKGQTEVMRMLIKTGAKVNAKNDKEETAMHFAAMSGKVECIEILVNAKGNVNERDTEGKTGLVVATRAADVGSVCALLAAKADVNLSDSTGCTPLHWAALNNSLDCARLLIEAKGVCLDKVDKDGISPYVMAIKSNSAAVLQALIDARCDRSNIDGLMGTAVALAALKGNAEVLETLLDNDEDPDECGYFGMTPLMLAAFESQVNSVDVLLRKGADVNAKARMGGTALQKSLMRIFRSNEVSRHEIVVRLLRANANVNYRITKGGYFTACTNGKNCPLSFAITAGYVSLVRMLLVAGSNVSHDEFREWMELNNIERFFDLHQLLDPIHVWKTETRSMKHICRSVIRNSISSDERRTMNVAIESLPIATTLKRYLNFEEFDHVIPERADVPEGLSAGMVEGVQVTCGGLKALEGTLLHQTILESS